MRKNNGGWKTKIVTSTNLSHKNNSRNSKTIYDTFVSIKLFSEEEHNFFFIIECINEANRLDFSTWKLPVIWIIVDFEHDIVLDDASSI